MRSHRAPPHIRRLLIALILVLLARPAAAPPLSDVTDCRGNGDNYADRIAACTRLIGGGAIEKNSLPDVYRSRGAAYLKSNDPDDAIRDFSEAINRRPEFADAYQNRGMAEFILKQYREALADLNRAIQYNKNSANFFNMRGVILNAMEEYDAAIGDFDTALKLDKNYVNAYHNRGYAYQRKRFNREALNDYAEAIRLAPTNPKFYIGRASVKMDIDKLDDAISDLNEAIRLDSKDSEAFLVRGETKRLKNDLVGALADQNQAISLSPGDEQAYVNRALVYRDQREYARATQDLDQAIVINPNGFLAYVNRGEVRRLQGEFDQSLKDLDKAVDLSPKSPLAHTLRGDTLREKTEFEKAIQDYDAANHFVSDFVPAYVGRGLALEAEGHQKAALSEFEQALKLPSYVDRARALPAQATAREHVAALDKQIPKVEARRAPLPDQGVRVALVVSMSKYQFVPALANPDRDAEAVAQALKAIGFNSVTLIEDAKRSAFVKALREFQDSADLADWALVYFAGHGIEIGGQNYLIPVDARLENERDAVDEAVSLDRVLDQISNAHKLQLVILDACRNNPFRTTMKRSDGTRGIDQTRGLARIEPNTPNELVVYSAKDGEWAIDGESGGHSPFSAALIARLKEPQTEINKVFRNVAKDVWQTTNHQQRPFVYGNSIDDFYFNIN